jgi:hypothetical protein
MGIFSRRRSTSIAAFMLSCLAGAPAFAASDAELALPTGCLIQNPQAGSDVNAPALKPGPWPTPIQIRTPLAPTIFASSGRNYLVYELHIQNFSNGPVTMRSIDVVDTDRSNVKRIVELQETQLNAVVRPAGGSGQYSTQAHVDSNRQLSAGQSAIAFLCLAFDSKAAVPRQLRHRLHLENERIDGPVVDVSPVLAPVLGRPLLGTDWRPLSGPHIGSHHRMGLWVTEGSAQISRRFAIDWLKFKNGESFAGDPRKVDSYFAYGEKVVSVADGIVVRASDGAPDNIPKTTDGFKTALPDKPENSSGNVIVIKLGDGQFAEYLHLQPGSVGVKVGDRVKKGQFIAKVGNSGDSRRPHLHFQLTTNPSVMGSEGLPFVIDQFRMKIGNGEWMVRASEFPWGDETVIDFGEDKFKSK